MPTAGVVASGHMSQFGTLAILKRAYGARSRAYFRVDPTAPAPPRLLQPQRGKVSDKTPLTGFTHLRRKFSGRQTRAQASCVCSSRIVTDSPIAAWIKHQGEMTGTDGGSRAEGLNQGLTKTERSDIQQAHPVQQESDS